MFAQVIHTCFLRLNSLDGAASASEKRPRATEIIKILEKKISRAQWQPMPTGEIQSSNNLLTCKTSKYSYAHYFGTFWKFEYFCRAYLNPGW